MIARVTLDETTLQSVAGREATPPVSVEELIEVAVERAIRRSFGPTYTTLGDFPQPAVYTVAQRRGDSSGL